MHGQRYLCVYMCLRWWRRHKDTFNAKLCGRRVRERPKSNVPNDTLGFPDQDCEMLHCSRVLQELKGHYLSVGEFNLLDHKSPLWFYCETIQSFWQLPLVREPQLRRYELVKIRGHELTKVLKVPRFLPNCISFVCQGDFI